MFDLAALKTTETHEEGAELELTHPTTGEPLGAFIMVVGTDSETYNKARRKMTDKRLKRKLSKLTMEDVERENIEMLASCTKGWRGVVINKEEVPYTFANACTLYTEYPWIREQVDAFMGDRANFLRD